MKEIDKSSYDEALHSYIDYVEMRVKQFEKFAQSLDKPDINSSDLEAILKSRYRTSLAINAEYTLLKRQIRRLQKEYDVWWATCYSDLRKELNPASISASKWTSKTEIEAEIIARYAEEYRNKKDQLDTLEDQASYLKVLIDSWDKIQIDCTQIIKIMGYEASALGMTDRIEGQIKRIRKTQ